MAGCLPSWRCFAGNSVRLAVIQEGTRVFAADLSASALLLFRPCLGLAIHHACSRGLKSWSPVIAPNGVCGWQAPDDPFGDP